jgi:hypothetical protein
VTADPETAPAPPPVIEVITNAAQANSSLVTISITVTRQPNNLLSFTLPFRP